VAAAGAYCIGWFIGSIRTVKEKNGIMWRACFPPDGANAFKENAYPAAAIALLRILCVGRHLTESLQHHKTGARRAT